MKTTPTLLPRLVSVLAGLLLILSASSATAAPFASLKNGFSPNPMVSDLIVVNVEKVSLSDKGWKCGRGETTREPALTFEALEDLQKMQVFFESSNAQLMSYALIVFPNGAVACAKKGVIAQKTWPKGLYRIYYFTSGSQISMRVRIVQPEPLWAMVKTPPASVPAVGVAAPLKQNPQWIVVPETPSARAREFGFSCVKKGKTPIRQVAKLVVKTKGTYYLALSRHTELFIAGGGYCHSDLGTSQNNTNYNGLYTFDPGTYVLWAEVSDPEKPMVLEVDARDQALAFGDAEIRELGDLKKPRLISGKTRQPARWPSRRAACNGSSFWAPGAPDFYLKTTTPLKQLEISLFQNRQHLSYRLYGPIESVDKNSSVLCDKTSATLRLDGTYAIWIASPPRSDEMAYDLLVMRTDIDLPPTQTLRPIPEEMPLEERLIGDHYPFLGRTSPAYLFTKAPKSVFVYAAQKVGDAATGVIKGEPLLLTEIGGDQAKVTRYDGTIVALSIGALAANRPARLHLPRKAAFRPAKKIREVWRLVDPAKDRKAVARYKKEEGRFRGCVGAWMKKNDPTWGKGYDLIFIGGKNSGKTMTDTKFAKAHKACNEPRLTKAEKLFARAVNRAARARAARKLLAVRRRFKIRG